MLWQIVELFLSWSCSSFLNSLIFQLSVFFIDIFVASKYVAYYNYLVFTTDMSNTMLIYLCKLTEESQLTHYNVLCHNKEVIKNSSVTHKMFK